MNAERLKKEMKKRGFSVTGICAECNISRSAWYRKISGEVEFTNSEMQRILKALNLKTPVGIFFD